MIERCGSQRRASEIGVQDDAGGVDDRLQRVTQRLTQLTFDRCGQAPECQVQRFFVELAVGEFLADLLPDLLTKTREHGANTFGDGGMTLP